MGDFECFEKLIAFIVASHPKVRFLGSPETTAELVVEVNTYNTGYGAGHGGAPLIEYTSGVPGNFNTSDELCGFKF